MVDGGNGFGAAGVREGRKVEMSRTRLLVVGAVVALIVVVGVALGLALARDGGDGDVTAGPDQGGPPTSAPTTVAPEPPTTAPPTTTTTAPPPEEDLLRRGDKGPEVTALQDRLREVHLDPGVTDGSFGLATLYAVQGFQKLNGLPPDGVVGPQVEAALASPAAVVPLVPEGGPKRVEVDLRRQLLLFYDGGALRLVTHVSTGSGERFCVEGSCSVADTPPGSYRFTWRYPGWRQSRLGKLYNPVYFTSDGIAVHGSESVPTHPASHGCVRIPMHIAEYFPGLVAQGDPVFVVDGTAPAAPPPTTMAKLPPPPPDPPTTPETTTTLPPETTTVPPTTVPPTTTTTTTATTTVTAPSTSTTTP